MGAPADTPSAAGGPLAGLRVLDLTSVMAGPYCTRLLADLGAEVIKVEPPEGDYLRTRPPGRDGVSTYFGHLNCGKQSVVVDLKKDGAAELVRRLADQADVLVENFRPGVAARLGLGAEDLTRRNPRLVYCSVSGYGQDGPGALRPAYAPIVHASSGFELAQMPRAANGQRPQDIQVYTADVMGGLYAFSAIQTALLERHVSGRGQTVDVSLLESIISVLIYEFQAAQFPVAEDRPVYSPLRCKDGFVVTSPISQRLFECFCAAIERPDLLTDPRFAASADRSARWTELMAEAETWTSVRTAAECEAILVKAEVPAAQYRGVGQVIDDPQLIHREHFRSVSDAVGVFQVPAPPFRFGRSVATPGPVPGLGQHTDAVLGQVLGLDAAAIAGLRASGAVA